MPKGHSTLEPRIKALEAQLLQQGQYIATLEKRIAEMQDSFNRGTLPQPRQYEPQFTVWPGAQPNRSNT